ncbi:TfoX/Sxy family protein [Arthrobacter sp. NPDC090010]|uniref:TfoX/Sxy family protein n=1 Tax=Arthrobacter sp. NPDC090010 TaxID=3363942 RepID=UPI0037F58335
MAYDEELAARMRGALSGTPGVSEKKMFGGLAFLVGGNMAVSASGNGGMMLRCEPSDSGRLTEEAGVERVVMRGKAMDGWLRVDDAVTSDDAGLARWVAVGVDFAKSLPPK